MDWGKTFERACNAVAAAGMVVAAWYAKRSFDLAAATASQPTNIALPRQSPIHIAAAISHPATAVNWWPINILIALSTGLLIVGTQRYISKVIGQWRGKRRSLTSPTPSSFSGQTGMGAAAGNDVSSVGFTSAPEPQDIADAKIKLCAFVMNNVSTLIDAIRPVIQNSSFIITQWDSSSPQALFAAVGINSKIIYTAPIDIFGDIQNIRAATLHKLEIEAVSFLRKYMDSVSIVRTVIQKTNVNHDMQRRWALDKGIESWLPKHRSFLIELEFLCRDVHYPRIRSTLKNEHYSQEWLLVFDEFLAEMRQSAS